MAKEPLSLKKDAPKPAPETSAAQQPALNPGETVDAETGEIKQAEKRPRKQREYRAADGSEYLPKVNAKSVMGDEYMKTKPTKEEDMFRIVGLVRRAEVTSGQYGDSYRFKGSFKIVRLTDGKKFTSTQLFVPRALEALIAEQIENALEGDDGDVQFAVILGRKPSTRGQTGYEYTFKPVLQVVQHDPLEALEAAANTAMPLLAAPTK